MRKGNTRLDTEEPAPARPLSPPGDAGDGSMRHIVTMVAVRIYTIDGATDLHVQGFWGRTRDGEIVLRGDVPRNLALGPGEAVLFDPTPLREVKQLEGVHARIILVVGTQQLRVEGAHLEMRGVTVVIRATSTVHGELESPSASTSTG